MAWVIACVVCMLTLCVIMCVHMCTVYMQCLILFLLKILCMHLCALVCTYSHVHTYILEHQLQALWNTYSCITQMNSKLYMCSSSKHPGNLPYYTYTRPYSYVTISVCIAPVNSFVRYIIYN